MALQLDLSADKTAIGIALPVAYAKVAGIVNANDTSATIIVSFYASEEARTANAKPVMDKSYTITGFDLITPIPIKATIYAFLKSLAEFEDAVDV
jgi:hypothetical protein